MDTLSGFSTIFIKGNNFCDYRLAFLDKVPFQNKKKKNVCVVRFSGEGGGGGLRNQGQQQA